MGERTPELLSPHANTAVGQVFLKQLQRKLELDVHALLIRDRARYRCAKHPPVPDNVAIAPPTPYSPRL